MQLLYEILIAAGPTAVVAAAGLKRYLRKRKPLQQLPEEDTPPEEEAAPPADPPRPEPTPPRKLTDDELIVVVTTHVAFSTKQVQVGVREIGREVIGYQVVESDEPEADYEVRPMRSPSERLSLLPGESTKPPAVALLRMLTGDALVMQPLRTDPITKPITEPVMQTLRRAVYVLLDVSGSMVQTRWRMRIGKCVALGLSRRCRQEESTFLFRPFCQQPLPLHEVRDDTQQADFETFLRGLSADGGTAIGPAIAQAIEDCAEQHFDSCDIMIVTDGEDDELNVRALRAQLTAHGIRLHAILLDVNNAALQRIADVCQRIPQEGVVNAPIIRADS